MQEVAKRAGVASSSVSRVLSGFPHVSEVMRNRVMDAVTALGYQPDLIARSLRSGATMTVGFVVGNISNPILSEVVLGAEVRLQEAGYSMLLTNSMNDDSVEARNITLLTQRRVDGLLLAMADERSPAAVAALKASECPLVLVDRELRASDQRHMTVSSVRFRHAEGMQEAVRHLASLGHRRVGLVNGPLGVRPARARSATLRGEARRLGLDATVRNGSFTAEHGFDATLALLTSTTPPTALIAGSNQILVGVLGAVRQLGLEIPRHLSLVTVDAVPLSAFTNPPLATVHRDNHEIGSAAAGLLLELLAKMPPRVVEIPTTYRPTESVGPPNQG